MTKAVFPGSFDPFTLGHETVVKKALTLFDKVIIAIGVNSNKKYLFPLNDRIDLIKRHFKDEKNLEVISFEGLTVDFCKKNSASVIIRGLRNTLDFQFEYEIANMNRKLAPEIESVFIVALPEHSAINSTIVREIYKNGGDVSAFLPAGIKLPNRGKE